MVTYKSFVSLVSLSNAYLINIMYHWDLFLHRHTLNVSHLTHIVFEIVLDWAQHNTKIRAIVYKNYRNFRCLTGFTFFFWLTAMSVVHMNHWLTCCCVEDYGLMRALFDGTVCNMF